MDLTKKFAFTALALMVSGQVAAADYSKVSEIPFKDDNFKQCVIAQNIEDPATITKLDCSQFSINTIDELANFPALKELQVSGSELKHVDLTHNPALESVFITKSKIDNIDVSQNPQLKELGVSFNHLSQIDLSHNPNLTDLAVVANNLTTLDLSKKPAAKISMGRSKSIYDH